MRAGVRLDSAVFQLTPTRTRCDLVIIANGKTEKLVSGLLDPFLAHLKVAQDQIAKGGYSITLEPASNKDAEWFTKGTIERFVRFVSTPEVLERVNTIESEILQIDEAIAVQGNDSIGFGTPGSHPPDSNGSTAQEEKSKVHLMRALETRKSVLQKEQGMAFARAVAAGFDMDHMSQLISFAECFGASRLLEACVRFMDLWKAKHESGQWVEIEATETRLEFSSLHASGIIFPGDIGKQKELGMVRPVSLATESNGKDSANAVDINAGQNKDPQLPPGPHDYYYQGQFQQPMFPQWPMPSASGAPVFQPYPVQAMPFYQNYTAGTPLFQTPYPPMEDPRFTQSQKRGLRRHSMDSKYSHTDTETWEMGGSGGRSKDAAERNISEDEEDVHQGRKSHKKLGHSRKKHESLSSSDSEAKDDVEHFHREDPKRKHNDSSRSIKRKNSITNSIDISDINGKDEVASGQEADAGNWQVFQSFLMKCEEENARNVDRGMLSGEKEPLVNRRKNQVNGDPVVSSERGGGGVEDLKVVEFDSANGRTIRRKQVLSKDELFSSNEASFKDGQFDSQFQEIEGGGRGYRRTDSDEFMHSSNTKDESFIVPSRLDTQVEFLANGRTALDMDAELPSSLQRSAKSSNNMKNKRNYEPHDLRLMPRRNERESVGYDRAADYDVEINAQDAVKLKTRNQGNGPLSTKKETKSMGKEKKTRSGQDGNEKRRTDLMVRKGKPTKPNPLADARARAEKLRLFKLDLQKAKKEKEAEALKRLEALKQERQKRIAARSGSSSTKPTLTPQQTRARLPAKTSPISSLKGSKFSDSEPTSSSPLTKVTRRATSLGSAGLLKTTKVDRLNQGTHSAVKELRRSASSLPDLSKESKMLAPEEKEKAASIRTRRLSDPKGMSVSHASSLKSARIDKLSKQIVSNEHQNKTRSASLPEPKVKPLTSPSDTTQNKAPKGTGSKNSLSSESHRMKRASEKSSRMSNGDESVVVDKTIVMLENETISASAIMRSEDVVSTRDGSFREDVKGKAELVPDYVAIRAPPSPLLEGEAEDATKHEVVVDYAKDEDQKLLNPTVTKKTYQAPFARATSLEDPGTNNLECKGTVSVVKHETSLMGSESTEARIPDWPTSASSEQIQDALEKPRSRESSKGFRKLFKFGKKNQSSAAGDHNSDSGSCSSLDDSTMPAASTEVSRPFSILSPFRTKTQEKKVVA
ncbi:beta-sandwich domain of Sec23/24 domain-containing protein [Dioscorea alata]|uniref:Beta-sandwich domain of Sec23/24 domain-containing protein n=1 Tax=Dioscorea alata TaxID=55571 RepID=A0ACB7WSQ8_DIOAL|nr:beta-sandwich domain of Sec23/24 domain-containing protein [Dioscorea alata]